MGKITINGMSFTGTNMQVSGGDIYIDGQKVEVIAKVTQIEITGDVGEIRSDCSVNVKGHVKGSVSAGGSVNCGDVGGDVSAGGSVNSDNVKGAIKAGGSVRVKSN